MDWILDWTVEWISLMHREAHMVAVPLSAISRVCRSDCVELP